MDVEELSELVAARAAALAYYSPYYFLRNLPAEPQQEAFGTGAASRWGQDSGTEKIRASVTEPMYWLLQQLAWDSRYFATPTYRLFTGLFTARSRPAELIAAAADLRRQLQARHAAFYAFSIVPAEDIQLLQALTGAGWQLIETRLTYFRDSLATFDYPRQPVRPATVADQLQIGQIAAAARNPYDRLHADSWFEPALADAYLAKYAENTVIDPALATTVLVPDAPGLPVDGFLAIRDLELVGLDAQLSRVLLTAVGPANRGWHVRLVAEALHRARELNQQAVLMTTQATNHAVFRTCEKLGFRLGSTAHVLTCHAG